MEGTSTFAVTTYAYDDHATPPTMTETLPDPDRAGPLAAPVVIHTYDRVGNEVSRTDPRNPSWRWETDYDAQDRVVATRSPDGLQTRTDCSVRPYTVTVTDPAEISTVTELDQLGRVVRRQVWNLAPTTYTYDLRGNLKREEVSRAGVVYTWEAHVYNAFGNLVEDRVPYHDGGSVRTVTTAYAYDAAGRLAEVRGPRPVNDTLAYEYDAAGRLVSATYWTSAAESYAATYTYNDAGELLQEKLERGQGLTPSRRRLLLFSLYRARRPLLDRVLASSACALIAVTAGPATYWGSPAAFLRAVPVVALGRMAAAVLLGLLGVELQGLLVPAGDGHPALPSSLTRYVASWLGLASAGLAAQSFPRQGGTPLVPGLLLLVGLAVWFLGRKGREPL